jgi:hypothetical protein
MVFMPHSSATARLITLQDVLGDKRMVDGRYYLVAENADGEGAQYCADLPLHLDLPAA